MCKKYPYYRNFKISGVVENKKDFQNGALTFECKHISKENNDPIIALETVRDYFKDNNISFDNFEVAKQRERIEIKI